MTEIDLVEIEKEDILFGKPIADAVGQHRFLQFALIASLRCQKKGFGDLLGNGAAPLHDAAGLQILEKSPCDAFEINAAMLVESRVLGRNKCLHQHRWNLFQRDYEAALFVELRNLLAVFSIDRADR